MEYYAQFTLTNDMMAPQQESKEAGLPRVSSAEKLGEPLPFVVNHVDPVKLNEYRVRYAAYRLGFATGARGEVQQVVEPTPEQGVADTGAWLAGIGDRESELKKLRSQLAAAQEHIRELERKVNAADAAAEARNAFLTPDADLNHKQLAARGVLREAWAKRSEERVARVQEAQAEVKSNVGRGTIEGSVYNFTTGQPVTTDVVVARGVVSNPCAASFEIIPMTSASSPIFVFTDETVNSLYGDTFVSGFEAMGYTIHRIVIPDGEDAKTLEVYAELADKCLSIGIDKHTVLISLGGGAVANVCGFIASTLHRGVGLIHFPTTLLAQCDASISHKQAVNAPHGKNLVGSYYAPIRIIVDPDVLQTLEDWLLPDGMGEIVKHALCQDTALLNFLEQYDGELADPDFLEYVVREVIKLKCEVIDIDPKENAEAVVLIYGHTIGHPIESLSHRPGSPCCLSHGQAVAIGCVIAARVAVLMGLADASVIEQTIRLCEKYHLPTQIPADQSVERIMQKLPYNKTWTKEGTVMALVERPGKLFNVDGLFKLPVEDSVIRQAVEATMAPFGTVIRGAGSSGFLRRNKGNTEAPKRSDPPKSDVVRPATAASGSGIPGAGWSNAEGGDKAPCPC